MDTSMHGSSGPKHTDTPLSLSLEILAVASGFVGIAVAGITALSQAVAVQEQKLKDARL